jgi:predicted ATPase/class 3 adenylate cyclase
MQAPTGNITFLFTDIERSSQLWEQHPQAMGRALARHDAIMQSVFQEHEGYVFKTIGDAFCVAFSDATRAVLASLAVQRELAAEAWEETGPLRVRMALHSGETDERDGDYFGRPLNRVARLLAAGHGGQTLLSRVTAERVREKLPMEISLRDLGERRLKDLSKPERIFQLVVKDLPADFPPLRSLEVLPNNLPAQVTTFVGRAREMAEVKRLIGMTRLLTLTGPGGTGKTRLAIQVAADALETFPHGVWLVELATLTDAALIPETIAAALDIREESGRPIRATLLDALRTRRMLIILDNCEHLVRGCAEIAESILRYCPDQRVLATSREALNIPGEMTWGVPSLATVRVDGGRASNMSLEDLGALDAVQLFVDRATAVRPDFTLNESNAAAIADICWRFDGIPLAIELAAARAKVLTPAQILARVDDRFRLLSGGSRTALPRQQTLGALIDWSYDLLNDKERALLQRLSVFVAGRTLEMAESVCTDDLIAEWEILDLLGSLVDKSLLSAEPDERGESRYVMLESVWDYSWDKLVQSGQSDTFRERHLEFFLKIAEEMEPKLMGPEQAECLHSLEAELYNFRYALEWSATVPAAITRGLRMCAAIARFWEVHSHLNEGKEHYDTLLARADENVPRDVLAKAITGAGRIAWCQDRDDAALRHYGDALAIFEELGMRSEVGTLHGFLGLTERNEENRDAARVHFERAMEIGEELKDKRVLGIAASGLGSLAADAGDLARGRALKERALQTYRALGDKWVITLVAWSLGKIVAAQHDHEAARACFREAVMLGRELGNRWSVPYALEGFGDIALERGEGARAATLYGAASTLRESVGLSFSPAERSAYDATLARIQRLLSPAQYQAHWGTGRAMRSEEALALALDGED